MDLATWVIQFAQNAVAVEADGALAHDIVRFLFKYLPPAPSAVPHVTFRLTPAEAGEGLYLTEGEHPLCDAAPAGVAAEILLGQAAYQLIVDSRSGLAFHAAAVSWRGQGVLLPGAISAGKSTLTAWLLTQGFHYLTDELVFCLPQTQSLQAFTRPLNLRSAARPALQRFLDLARPIERGLSHPTGELIPPEVFSPLPVLNEAPLRLIFFPTYQPGSELRLERLSKAQTGSALMQCLVNARNLPGHGFPYIAQLAQSVPAYRMVYSDFEQLDRPLKDLLPAECP